MQAPIFYFHVVLVCYSENSNGFFAQQNLYFFPLPHRQGAYTSAWVCFSLRALFKSVMSSIGSSPIIKCQPFSSQIWLTCAALSCVLTLTMIGLFCDPSFSIIPLLSVSLFVIKWQTSIHQYRLLHQHLAILIERHIRIPENRWRHGG